MLKPPLPETATVLLARPDPAVIGTLRPDAQPVSTAS